MENGGHGDQRHENLEGDPEVLSVVIYETDDDETLNVNSEDVIIGDLDRQEGDFDDEPSSSEISDIQKQWHTRHVKQLSSSSSVSSTIMSFLLPPRKMERLYRFLMFSAVIILVAYMINIGFNALGVHIFVIQKSVVVDLIHVKDVCSGPNIPIHTISRIHTPTFINILFHNIHLNITVPSVSSKGPIIATRVDHVFFLQDALPCTVDHEFDLVINTDHCSFPNIFDRNITYSASLQLGVDMRNIWLPFTWNLQHEFPEQSLESFGQDTIPFVFNNFIFESFSLSDDSHLMLGVDLEYKSTMEFLKVSLPELNGFVQLKHFVNSTNDNKSILFYYHLNKFVINRLDPVSLSLSLTIYKNCTENIIKMVQDMMTLQPFQWKALLEPPSTPLNSSCFLKKWFRSLGGYPVSFNFTPGNDTQYTNHSVSFHLITAELIPRNTILVNSGSNILPNMSISVHIPHHMIAKMIPDGVLPYLGSSFNMVVKSTISIRLVLCHVLSDSDYLDDATYQYNAKYQVNNNTSLVIYNHSSLIMKDTLPLYELDISFPYGPTSTNTLTLSDTNSTFAIQIDAISLITSFDEIKKIISIQNRQIVLFGHDGGSNALIDRLISNFAILISLKDTKPTASDRPVLDIGTIFASSFNTWSIYMNGNMSYSIPNTFHNRTFINIPCLVSLDLLFLGTTNPMARLTLDRTNLYLDPIALDSTRFSLSVDVDTLINTKMNTLGSNNIQISISTDDITSTVKTFNTITRITVNDLENIFETRFRHENGSFMSIDHIELYIMNNSCASIGLYFKERISIFKWILGDIVVPECLIDAYVQKHDHTINLFQIIVPSMNISAVDGMIRTTYNPIISRDSDIILLLYIKPNWTSLWNIIETPISLSDIKWRNSKSDGLSNLISNLLNNLMVSSTASPEITASTCIYINLFPISDHGITFNMKITWSSNLYYPPIKWSDTITMKFIYDSRIKVTLHIESGNILHYSENTVNVNVSISMYRGIDTFVNMLPIKISLGSNGRQSYISFPLNTIFAHKNTSSFPSLILTLKSIEALPCFMSCICPKGPYTGFSNIPEYIHSSWILDWIFPNINPRFDFKITINGSIFESNPYINIFGTKGAELSIITCNQVIIPNINGSSSILEIHMNISRHLIDICSYYMSFTVISLYMGSFGIKSVKEIWKDTYGYITNNHPYYDAMAPIPYDVDFIFPSCQKFLQDLMNGPKSSESNSIVFKSVSYELNNNLTENSLEFIMKYTMNIDGPDWIGLSLSGDPGNKTFLWLELEENNVGLVNIMFIMDDPVNRGAITFGRVNNGTLRIKAIVPRDEFMESRFYDVASRWVLTQGMTFDMVLHLGHNSTKMNGVTLPCYFSEPEFARYVGSGLEFKNLLNNTFHFPVALYLFSVITYFRNPAWDFPVRMKADNTQKSYIHDDSSTARIAILRKGQQGNCSVLTLSHCYSYISEKITDCPSFHSNATARYFRDLRANLIEDSSFANRSFKFVVPKTTDVILDTMDISGSNAIVLMDTGICKCIKGKIIMDIPSYHLPVTDSDICGLRNGALDYMCDIHNASAMHERTKKSFLFYINFNKTIDSGQGHADFCRLQLGCTPNVSALWSGMNLKWPSSDAIALPVNIPLSIEFRMALFGSGGIWSRDICAGLWIGSNNASKALVFEWKFMHGVGHIKCSLEVFMIVRNNKNVVRYLVPARGSSVMTYRPIPNDYFKFDKDDDSKYVSVNLNFTRMDKGRLIITMDHSTAMTKLHEIYYNIDLYELFKDGAFASTFVSRNETEIKVSSPKLLVTTPDMDPVHCSNILMRLEEHESIPRLHRVSQELEYALAVFDTCANPLYYSSRIYEWNAVAKLDKENEFVNLKVIDRDESSFFVYFSFKPAVAGLYQIIANISVRIPTVERNSTCIFEHSYVEHGYGDRGLSSRYAREEYSNPELNDVGEENYLKYAASFLMGIFDYLSGDSLEKSGSLPLFNLSCKSTVTNETVYVGTLNLGFIQVVV